MTLTPRHLRVAPRFTAGPWRIKPYHVNIDDRAIEPRLVEAAYDMLLQLLPEPDGDTPAAAFVVVHRGRQALYVNAYAWVWDNVLHMRSAAGAEPFLGCPDDDPTHLVVLEQRYIGCIWELPPLEHERSAWVRHVFGSDAPNVDAYLADTFAPVPSARSATKGRAGAAGTPLRNSEAAGAATRRARCRSSAAACRGRQHPSG